MAPLLEGMKERIQDSKTATLDLGIATGLSVKLSVRRRASFAGPIPITQREKEGVKVRKRLWNSNPPLFSGLSSDFLLHFWAE
jgi:hypothetical protein